MLKSAEKSATTEKANALAAAAAAAAEEKPEPEPEPAAPAERVSGEADAFEFQAETKQLLDIVANSLYTDKEVFVRELISNASDALNKLRSLQVSGGADSALPLEISIATDEAAGTVTIADTGIGMTKDELVANLGPSLPAFPPRASAAPALICLPWGLFCRDDCALRLEGVRLRAGGRRGHDRRDDLQHHRALRRGVLLGLYGLGRDHRLHAQRRRRGARLLLVRTPHPQPAGRSSPLLVLAPAVS